MNINFGLIPPLDHRVKGKRNKNAELSARSLAVIDAMREEILADTLEGGNHLKIIVDAMGGRQRPAGNCTGRTAGQ